MPPWHSAEVIKHRDNFTFFTPKVHQKLWLPLCHMPVFLCYLFFTPIAISSRKSFSATFSFVTLDFTLLIAFALLQNMSLATLLWSILFTCPTPQTFSWLFLIVNTLAFLAVNAISRVLSGGISFRYIRKTIKPGFEIRLLPKKKSCCCWVRTTIM
jgi:hypothetical protein